jgi:hypothetical protein
MRLTAVEWLIEEIHMYPLRKIPEYIQEQAKEMERGQVQLYVIFCLRCMKEDLPVIRFEDFIKLEGGEK